MKIRSELPHRSVSLLRCTSALRNECTELTFLPLSTSFLCIIPRFWQQFTRTTGYGSIGNSSGKPGYKSRQFCVTLSWFVNKNVSRSPFSENQCFIFTQLLLSYLWYNSACSIHRWKDISSEFQTKKESSRYHSPEKSNSEKKRATSELGKPQLTSITTVKCNGFISKVASLSDVKYTGVSYLGIFIRDRCPLLMK